MLKKCCRHRQTRTPNEHPEQSIWYVGQLGICAHLEIPGKLKFMTLTNNVVVKKYHPSIFYYLCFAFNFEEKLNWF